MDSINPAELVKMDPKEIAKFEGDPTNKHLVDLLHETILKKGLNTSWEDIVMHGDIKDVLIEAISLPLMQPNYFKGIRRPWKGILLYGPPGTGKTMLAKAVATETQVTFFNISSSVLTSKYHGESEKLICLLFKMARYYNPSIIFFDEIDAVCAPRGADLESEVSRKMKAELLLRMEGLEDNEKEQVVVLGATNRPWCIDEGFRRRFQKRVYVPLPEEEAITELINVKFRGINLDKDFNPKIFAKSLVGYSCSDITNVCREASFMGMRERIKGVKPAKIKEIPVQELEVPITIKHFEAAMKNISSSVNLEDIKKFEDFKTKYGAC